MAAAFRCARGIAVSSTPRHRPVSSLADSCVAQIDAKASWSSRDRASVRRRCSL